MRLVQLLILSLVLLGVTPSVAKACSCAINSPESVMRQGSIVARVLVLQRTRTEHENGASYSATAFVQESFSGPFPNRLISVHWSRDYWINCPNSGLPPVGQTAVVWLFYSTIIPSTGNTQYRTESCADFPSYVDDADEVLDRFARLREQNEGVWVDVFEFQRELRHQPTLSQLQEAFPEVEIVSRSEAPPDLGVSWDYILGWPDDETVRSAVALFRPDQSRFIATMRGNRVIGGDFR